MPKLERSVKKIVHSLCADYARRAKLLHTGRLPMRKAAAYATLNAAIDNAIDMHTVPAERHLMMQALQDRRGYVEHKDIRGKNQFYKRKSLIVEEIAKSLDFI